MSEEVMENESSVQSRFLLIEMLKFHLSIQLMISLRKSILLMMMQKERGFDSIVLAIETDTEQTYSINDTEDGFQCDEFDYYF